MPGAANLRLGRVAGSLLGRQMILQGRRIRATKPDACLLIDEVAEPEEMDDAVERAAARLRASAVVANRHMVILAEKPPDDLRRYLAEFAVQQARRLYSADVFDKVRRRAAVTAGADRPRVRYDKRDNVAYVTLDRPDRLNAMDLRVHAELAEVWEERCRRSADAVEGPSPSPSPRSAHRSGEDADTVPKPRYR